MFAQSFSVCYSPLSLLKPKEKGVITRFNSANRELVNELTTMGIIPGVKVTLEENSPSFIIKFNLNKLLIDKETANSIYVRVTYD